MTITEQQAIAIAKECGVQKADYSWNAYIIDDKRLHSFALRILEEFGGGRDAASVEAENVRLRRLIERMISATDTPDARYWTNEYDRHRPTSTEHLDAIVAERVREALKGKS